MTVVAPEVLGVDGLQCHTPAKHCYLSGSGVLRDCSAVVFTGSSVNSVGLNDFFPPPLQLWCRQEQNVLPATIGVCRTWSLGQETPGRPVGDLDT